MSILENILFITPSRLGDGILSTGILSYLREHHFTAKITVVTSSLCENIFSLLKEPKQIIVLDKQPYKKHWFELWGKLKKTRWDVIVDLRGSILPYFLGHKKRYSWQKFSTPIPKVQQLSMLLELPFTASPTLWLEEDLVKKPVSNKLAVAPWANWIGKQWPMQNFIKCIEQMQQTFDAEILVFGGPEDNFAEIDLPNVQNYVGKLPLIELAKVMLDCRCFFGNDTGLMHLAAAVGLPCLALFGPSDDRIYGPWPQKTGIHKVARTPLGFEEMQKIPNFAFNAPQSYMLGLKTEAVYDELHDFWIKKKTYKTISQQES